MLWLTLTLKIEAIGPPCVLVGPMDPLSMQEPGSAFGGVAALRRYWPGNSPWPTLMPPDNVPELL